MKSLPFTFIIHNESDQIQKAVLFGGKENSHDLKFKPNYGSDNGIKITSGYIGVSYLEMLVQSMSQPFKVGLTEFYSNPQQLALPIHYTYMSENEDLTTNKPIDLKNIDGRSETLDIKLISADNKIEFNVLPKAIIVVKVYPSEKLNN